MAITINGTSNTITGLTAGGLPDNTIDNGSMADDAIGVAELSATGTASSSTYLRGDNAWATIAGGDNTPSWLATSNADQSISSGTWTKITNLGTEEWDTDNGFASNAYTVPSGKGGRYCIFFGIRFPAIDSGETMLAEVKVNDDGVDWSDIQYTSGNSDQNLQGNGSFIVTLAAGDVVEMNVYHNEGGAINAPTGKNTFLGGFKLA